MAVFAPRAGDNAPFRFGASYSVDSLCYDLARSLEGLGYRSLMTIQRSGSHPDPMTDENPTGVIVPHVAAWRGRAVIANTVITRMARVRASSPVRWRSDLAHSRRR